MIGPSASNDYIHKYHHRGELSRKLPTGAVTKPARSFSHPTLTEDLLNLKIKYQDTYIDTSILGQIGTVRCIMFSMQLISYHKDTGKAFSNFMKLFVTLH
jgi:hypothetical protein